MARDIHAECMGGGWQEAGAAHVMWSNDSDTNERLTAGMSDLPQAQEREPRMRPPGCPRN